jgi:hypothetical protein
VGRGKVRTGLVRSGEATRAMNGMVKYGGGWFSDEWRRGYADGHEQWDGKTGFIDP